MAQVTDSDRVAYARATLTRWVTNLESNGDRSAASLYRDALSLIDGVDDEYIAHLKERGQL